MVAAGLRSAAIAAGLALSGGFAQAPSEGGDARPNILLIMSDQHNARYLGCEGHPFLETPNIDRIASEGVRFRAAYCNSPICAPARAATMYGRYPVELGVVTNGSRIRRKGLHLAQHLERAGYATGVSGKTHLMPMERGRLAFQAHMGPAGGVTSPLEGSSYATYLERLLEEQPELFPEGRWRSWEDVDSKEMKDDLDLLRGTSRIPEAHYPATLVTEAAVGFIDRSVESGKPFFLFASYFIPHHPYFPPVPFDTLYAPDDVSLPPSFFFEAKLRPFHVRNRERSLELYGEEGWREIIAHYCGLVSLLDKQVGILLERLEQHGILDDTLILFMADHGDMMGELGVLLKSRIEDGSSRIPMLLRFGDHVSRGLVVDEPTEQVDVFATCLEAAGVALPRRTRGSSLLGLANGNAVGRKPYAFGSLQSKTGNYRIFVRGERHKFGLHGSRFEEEALPFYFDLQADPWEMNNLALPSAVDPAPEVRARLEEALRAWWEEQLALEPATVSREIEDAYRKQQE